MSLIEWLDSEHEVAAIDDLQQKKTGRTHQKELRWMHIRTTIV